MDIKIEIFKISITFLFITNSNAMFTVKKTPYYYLAQKRKLQKSSIGISTKDPIPLKELKDIIVEPDDEMVYITGSENIRDKNDIVTIQLSSVKKYLPEIERRIERYKRENKMQTIPLPDYSIRIIKPLMLCIHSIAQKTPLHSIFVLSELFQQMSLKDTAKIIKLSHYLGLKESIDDFLIEKFIVKLVGSNIDEIMNINLDLETKNKVFSSSNIAEVLKLLIIKKYANRRKIILNGHSKSVDKVLCSANGTRIVSLGKSSSYLIHSYQDLYVWDLKDFKPIQSIQKKADSLFREDFINLLDLSHNGKKLLLELPQQFSLYDLPISLPSTFDELKKTNNIFDQYYCISALFNPSATRIIIHSQNIRDENISPLIYIDDVEKGIASWMMDYSSGHSTLKMFKESDVDFIDDETILTVLYNTDSHYWTAARRNIKTGIAQFMPICLFGQTGLIKVSGRYNMIACYPETIIGKALYVFESNATNNPVTEHLINFIPKSIQFSKDGSHLICLTDTDVYFFNIEEKKFIDMKLRSSHADISDNILICSQGNNIVLKNLTNIEGFDIKKYLSFETVLSGLSGKVTSVQWSPDESTIIASSNAQNNNLIVWPLIIPEEQKKTLEALDNLDMDTKMLLLPVAIASLEEKTTPLSQLYFDKIRKLPQMIQNLLLISLKPFSSRLPEILATE